MNETYANKTVTQKRARACACVRACVRAEARDTVARKNVNKIERKTKGQREREGAKKRELLEKRRRDRA